MISTKKNAGCRWCILVSMLLIAGFVFATGTSAALAESKTSIKAMTQNMDAGTDLKLVFAFLPNITEGATYTYAELLQNDIPGRAEKLADEIAAKKPDIISLQEVTLWRTGASVIDATDVLFDQLDLLLDALAGRKVSYYVVNSQELTDIAVPMDLAYLGLPQDPQLAAIRFTDRDVILARSDLHKSQISITSTAKGLYGAALDFDLLLGLGSPIPVDRGWISVDLKIGNEPLRFFGTHLESTYPGAGAFDLLAQSIQAAQATELVGLMDADQMPVILAGDFNANPVPNGFENTATPGILSGAGYTEVWNALHPFQEGFTWPLYLEDPQAPNPTGPYERIDLIYQRDLDMLNIERVIRQSYPFASDHAGVVATLRVNSGNSHGRDGNSSGRNGRSESRPAFAAHSGLN
jgi:endonuclease/exonuclease/phosphatase family metal-dependent hydrolase